MTDEACRARVQFADRTQTGFCVTDLESLLPRDHPARSVWAYVEGLDLSRGTRRFARWKATRGVMRLIPGF